MGTWFRSYVIVGVNGNILYRFLIDAEDLQAHPKDAAHEAELRKPTTRMLGSHFLGVNTTVQPQEPAEPASRRVPNLSETSTISTVNDDSNAPDFVFFQVGDLQYAELPDGKEWGWPNDEDRAHYHLGWKYTAFNLVARLDLTGRVDSIYAIYNMFPIETDPDEYADEDDDIRNKVTGVHWGIPPTPKGGERQQFTCATLGRSTMFPGGKGSSTRSKSFVSDVPGTGVCCVSPLMRRRGMGYR